MLCKTEWSWELRTWSHKMNLLDILSTSPHYFCRKWIGATNENSNFDLVVYRVNWAISLIVPHYFFNFRSQTSQPYRQTSTLSNETIPSNLTPAQTTTSEYHNRPSSDPPNQTIRTDHHRRTRQPDQIRSDHPTRPQTTILDSSDSKQHSIPNILEWYKSGAFIMGWVKGGI